jgi:hypothetical protein
MPFACRMLATVVLPERLVRSNRRWAADVAAAVPTAAVVNRATMARFVARFTVSRIAANSRRSTRTADVVARVPEGPRRLDAAADSFAVEVWTVRGLVTHSSCSR